MYHYQSVIDTRYPAPLLSKLWSPLHRITTMRQLWIDLAIIQQYLGVSIITNEAIDELQNNRDNIDMDTIDEYETKLKHDIMAHISAYSDLCPVGGKILHLGATSNFINDNIDSIIVKDSFDIIKSKTNKLIELCQFKSNLYADIPTIAYTHIQPAQLITIGRRFAMWQQDIMMDAEKMERLKIPFRGCKGTVGTEDTLMKLFNGDPIKCDALNLLLSQKYGFSDTVPLCGQTYSRKYDVEYMNALSGLCQSIYKMMNDLRLLSGKMEVYEEFTEYQVGSSAMPYKKNPINCEKICSLCRLVINNEQNMVQTYINQWLERSLDDSAIKRIVFPETFLLVEYILNQSINIIENLDFKEDFIRSQVETHMQNIVSEEIILCGVKMGYSRQCIHERLRVALTNKKEIDNGVEDDSILKKIIETNKISYNPKDYIGRSVEQCHKLINK